MTLSRTRTLLGMALTCLLVLALQIALGGSSGFASSRLAAKGDSETYTVTGRIPKTWHVEVLEIGFCLAACRSADIDAAVSSADVAANGSFTITDLPSDSYGVLIRYDNTHGKQVAFLSKPRGGVYRLSYSYVGGVFDIRGDTDLGLIKTKSLEPHYPEGRVSYTGGGTPGGHVTLFYQASHLRKVSVVSLTYYGCGHVLAHRRFTGLTGSHKFRLTTKSLRGVPRWRRSVAIVTEPNRDRWYIPDKVGPVKGAHC